jgi:hypothetical protein
MKQACTIISRQIWQDVQHALPINSTTHTQLRLPFLLAAGLWGIPHDKTGKMVGMGPLQSPTEWPPKAGSYRSAAGPVQLFDPDLKRLQWMFDQSERCYPRL